MNSRASYDKFKELENFMTKRTRIYLEMFFVVILLLIGIYFFDLPKINSFVILGVVVVINILFFELFAFKNKK